MYDTNVCIECQGDLFAHNAMCVETCPDFFYQNGEIKQCSRCGKDCRHCIDNEQCTQCIRGFTVEDGECVDLCPDGYLDENDQCTPCDENCKSCELIDGSLECKVCDQGFYLTPSKDCVPSCKDAGFV